MKVLVLALASLFLAGCSLDFDGFHLKQSDAGKDGKGDGGGTGDGGADGSSSDGGAEDGGGRDDGGGGTGGHGGTADGGGDDAGSNPGNDAGGSGAVCGDGKVEGQELCDGDCPKSCDDDDPCTVEALAGSKSKCDLHCEVSKTITAAKNDDACCPSSANANNDNDCKPKCGNGVTESGETCDDHNQANGDNCDPTCTYFNDLSLLSGHPGRKGYSDGTKNTARFYNPRGITHDGNVLYVSDENGSVIRKIDSKGVVTTVAGRMFDRGECNATAADNGVGADARFCYPGAIAVLGGKLWIVDNNIAAGLRVIDLATSAVSYDNSLSTSQIKSLKADGNGLLFYDGALKRWDPSKALDATNPQVLGTQANIYALAGTQCNGIEKLGTSYYLACGSQIVQVTSAGVVSRYAGGNSQTCTDNATDRLSAGFWGASDITTDGSALFVANRSCRSIRRITSGVTTYAGSGASGFADGSAATAEFGDPVGIAYVNPTGLFVADWYNSSIRKVDPSVSTWAGYGTNWDMVYAADGASSRYSASPNDAHHAIATDGAYAYFWRQSLSGDASVGRVDLQTGGSVEFATSPNWTSAQAAYPPADLAVLDDFLYLALDGSIWRVPLADGSSPARYAGTDGAPGETDAPIASATLQARSLAADPASKTLYFIDANHTLRRINVGAANPSVLTLAGVANASAVMNGDLQSAQFANPLALTFDGTFLYLLDGTATWGQRLVRKIDLAGNDVSTIIGADVDEPRADGRGTDVRLVGGLALATDGKSLFIADRGDALEYDYSGAYGAAIRQVSLSTLDTTTMIGRDDLTTTLVGVGTDAAIFEPAYMTFDPTGQRLLIFDRTEGVFLQIR